MKWYEVELEIPIYGKNFETIQAPDKDSAIKIAIKNTINQYPLSEENINIILVREINI
tara:strand:+ start:409 stop:582 length:174 start_codon:yes stop_codon:yes gene_type:complete